jgi:hypothetical protein
LWLENLKGENHVEGCKDNIKMDLKKLVLEGVEAGDRWRALVSAVRNLRVP